MEPLARFNKYFIVHKVLLGPYQTMVFKLQDSLQELFDTLVPFPSKLQPQLQLCHKPRPVMFPQQFHDMLLGLGNDRRDEVYLLHLVVGSRIVSDDDTAAPKTQSLGLMVTRNRRH